MNNRDVVYGKENRGRIKNGIQQKNKRHLSRRLFKSLCVINDKIQVSRNDL